MTPSPQSDPTSDQQKLAAIGRLTGEIAHEFNNLLHVINMNLELISVLAKEEKARPAVDRARVAARRGAKLTGELLSFTRSAAGAQGPTRINELLLGMRELLAVSAGSGVVVELQLCDGPAVAIVDAVQLELQLLTLAESTRSVLPEGGVLKISTRVRTRVNGQGRAHPGDDVVINVDRRGAGEDSTVELAYSTTD